MLVRELLNEEQLDEASLKQMIAGAALALGLGISGSASADQLFVYLSPETGKLRAVTDMSRVPANATMSFKVDTDAKTVSMIKGANAPVSPEVAKSAVQSAPKSNPVPVKVAEPDNVKSTATVDKKSDELDQVKKNAGIDNSVSPDRIMQIVKQANHGIRLFGVNGRKTLLNLWKERHGDNEEYKILQVSTDIAFSKPMDFYSDDELFKLTTQRLREIK